MRLFRRIFATVVAMTATIGPSLAGDSLQAVFANMDRASAKFKGLTADVKKVSHTEVIHEDSVDIGKVVVRVPKPHNFQMLIDFQQPDPKTVAIAETKAEVYYPKRKVVECYDFGKTRRSQVEQFLLLGFGSNSRDLLNAYSVTLGGPETAAGEKTTRIELVPKLKDLLAQFPKFELWISDKTGVSVQQKMYQPGGDYSLATYTNMQIDPNISESAVKLSVPKGVTREYPQK